MLNITITLCGSARFEPWFHLWNEALGLAGHSVFGLCAYPSQHDGNKDWYTPAEKETLDQVHFRKIETSDAIVVLNVFAYFGESTRREIAHAREHGKGVYFLESWGQGLGIGDNHYKHVQEAAKRYGVLYAGSPIDTFHPHGRDVYHLLGPAGERRSAIVTRLKDARLRLIGPE